MNNIGIEEAYNLCRSLKDTNNVYGISNVDSHLTKNSEWGAVAYLSYSKYGRNGTDVAHNNISLNNSTNSLYAVTGYAKSAESDAVVTTTLPEVTNGTKEGAWKTTQGQTASSTGNVYGVYDLNGGSWEWTAGYFDKEEEQVEQEENTEEENNLTGESSKYKTKYEEITTSSLANINTTKGEAIWELNTNSIAETNTWNDSKFSFVNDSKQFSIRGGDWHENSNSGIFAFDSSDGTGTNTVSFRAVLIVE